MGDNHVVPVPDGDADIWDLVKFGHTFDGYAAAGSLPACAVICDRI